MHEALHSSLECGNWHERAIKTLADVGRSMWHETGDGRQETDEETETNDWDRSRCEAREKRRGREACPQP